MLGGVKHTVSTKQWERVWWLFRRIWVCGGGQPISSMSAWSVQGHIKVSCVRGLSIIFVILKKESVFISFDGVGYNLVRATKSMDSLQGTSTSAKYVEISEKFTLIIFSTFICKIDYRAEESVVTRYTGIMITMGQKPNYT